MTELLTSSHKSSSRGSSSHSASVRRAARVRMRFVPRGAGFWLVGAIATGLLAASSAPTPLYPVYQVEFGFSALTLTVVFAVYVLALLAMLLTVGRLSDFVGRRPVLAGALVVEAGAMATFLTADGTTALLAARVLQGLATGAATGVLGAYLLDLQPPNGSRLGSLVNSVAPATGLSIGAIGTGVLVQFAPHPTRLIFVILTALFVVLAGLVAVLPETVSRTPGAASALVPRVAVPVAARGAFARTSPLMIAVWALGGLMLSLGASVLESVLGVTSHAEVGVVIGIFAGSAAVTSVLARDLSPHRLATLGTFALATGTMLFLAGLLAASLPVFVAAMVVAGSGFGSGFLGALRAVSQLAAPHERGGLLSAVYVVSYLAFSVPAVVAGVLVAHAGLRTTAIGYGIFIAALVLVAAATVGRGSTTDATATS